MTTENQEVCISCRVLGFCWFEAESIRIARSRVKSVYKKHQEIADARKVAEGWVCKKVNEVDPDYPGKRSL